MTDEKSVYRKALEKIAGLDDQGNPTGCQSHLECIHTAQVVLVSNDSGLYKVSYKYVENPSERLKPETITLKNLFTAYAADIEKVANELVQPHASGQISVPPEVIEYWVQHIEVIMELDSKSLLGKEKFTQPLPFTPDEELVLREGYARYVLENHKMRMITTKVGWPLSFDEWWRAKADNIKENRESK